MAEPKTGVFISHIVEESLIAKELQAEISACFQGQVKVFVSSDGRSIPGGEDWWNYVRQTLKGETAVTLVLLSSESAARGWINYEAGLADGSGSAVIPVAIRSFTFDKLKFPILGFNGRYLRDIQGIVTDLHQVLSQQISSWMPVTPKADTAAFMDRVRKAEAMVNYRSVLLQPHRFRSEQSWILGFTMLNQGNLDVDLVMVEIGVPVDLIDNTVHRSSCQNVLDWTTELIEGTRYAIGRYTTTVIPPPLGIQSLRPVLTRSMGRVSLNPLRVGLKGNLTDADLGHKIYFQLFARNYDSARESVEIQDVPELIL